MTVAKVSANNTSTIPRQRHPAAITQMVMDGLRCPLGDATRSERCRRPRLIVYFNLFQSVRPLVHGIKTGHLIGQCNNKTTNMAALAVSMCLAVNRLLDTLHSSVWAFQAQCALAQKLTVIFWCEGTALATGTWVFLFHYLGV